jgi:hypothetical protein
MQQYQIRQSSTINQFRITVYCLVFLAIGIFLHGLVLTGSLTLLTALLLFRDQTRYNYIKSQDPTIVTLRDDSTRVELNHRGDHLRFEQFRLFSNRWFLILQLKNEQASKNIMLVSDRFKTINEYLQFRYQIINMSNKQHAA